MVKDRDIVAVYWQDITEHARVGEEHSMGPCECVSYGELYECNKKQVVIVRERIDDNGTVMLDKQAFPRGCVRLITRLLEAPMRR